MPAKWTTKQNVLWKQDIPGMGWSSPILWGDKIFVTSVEQVVRIRTGESGEAAV